MIIGKTLSNKNTPAITSVDEWINALTGVGALIAFINQELNGNCADFTNVASISVIAKKEYICGVVDANNVDVIKLISEKGRDAREEFPVNETTKFEIITKARKKAISPIIFIKNTLFESIDTAGLLYQYPIKR